jgi:hypothetical protein
MPIMRFVVWAVAGFLALSVGWCVMHVRSIPTAGLFSEPCVPRLATEDCWAPPSALKDASLQSEAREMPFDYGFRLNNRQRIANAKPIEANKNQSVDGAEGLFLRSVSPQNV